MATINENIDRIKGASDNLKEVVGLCFGGVGADTKIGELAPILARVNLDDATSQVVGTAERVTADGAAIRDGVALLEKVEGETIVWNQLLIGDGYREKYNCVTEIIDERESKITATINSNSFNIRLSYNTTIGTTDNHFYLFAFFINTTKDITIGGGFGTNMAQKLVCASGNYQFFSSIVKESSGRTGGSLWFGTKKDELLIGDVVYVKYLSLIDLTKMFGSGKEPTTIDEFTQRIFGVDADQVTDADWQSVSAYCEPTLLSTKPSALVSKDIEGVQLDSVAIDPTAILDEEGNQLFPDGLRSAGEVCDEIDYENGVAIKRVEADYTALTTSALATPIQVPIQPTRQLYKVSNGGREQITADGVTTPLHAKIAYREAVTASEALTMLADAANVNE